MINKTNTEKGLKWRKKLKMAEKKYFDQLSSVHSTQKLVSTHSGTLS